MSAEERITIRHTVCDGYGVCAELLPELIGRDEWGYPIIADRPVPAALRKHAKRAVAACPRLALSTH